MEESTIENICPPQIRAEIFFLTAICPFPSEKLGGASESSRDSSAEDMEAALFPLAALLS